MALRYLGTFRRCFTYGKRFYSREHTKPLEGWPKRKRHLPLTLLVVTTITGSAGLVYYYLQPEVQRRSIRVSLGGITRFLRSSRIGSVISMDYYWSLWGLPEGSPEYNDALASVHRRSAHRILNGCLRNGGLYVKLGQGLVVMDHILPKEYIETLKVLQDKCLERSPGEVHELFEEDFGKPLEELFESFDEKPVAAASLAQVFKATTKSGKSVAVKAQYIDLQDRFTGDIKTLHFLLNLAGRLFPDFNFAWVLNELHGTLEKELNFLNEGKNSEKCAEDLAHMPYVYVPKVEWELSSTRVLTTEFIDGIKISDTKALKEQGFSLADIDSKLFKAFAEQIFHTGFVHADPHAGNILVRKGEDKKAQLVILDHGLYEEVPEGVTSSLRDLWKAVVLSDHKAMKMNAMQLGVRDYYTLAEMITQRPLKGTKVFKLSFLTESEMQIMTEIASKHFNEIMTVLRELPHSVILVLRNINTIRSIAHGHGNPVDRYKVMARCATQGSFSAKKGSILGQISSLQGRFNFELQLWWGGVKMWFMSTFLKALMYFRRGSSSFLQDSSTHFLNHP